MKSIKLFFIAAQVVLTVSLSSAHGQIYEFTTIAGSAGDAGATNGTGTRARFYYPMGIVTDTNDNIYVTDYGNSTIRQIIPVSGSWVVTTIAGSAGTTGSSDGVGTAALFNTPAGIAITDSGTLYVADYANHTIRAVVSVAGSWLTTTVAGIAGTSGSDDGVGSEALFYNPTGVSVDHAGNLYVADYGNHTIRQIVSVSGYWVVLTIAGTAGKSGSTDGTGDSARFSYPTDVKTDNAGNLYVVDSGNHTIRKLTLSGTNWVVSTVAGRAGHSGSSDGTNNVARFKNPYFVTLDSAGNLFVADVGNDMIRRIIPSGTNWIVTTVGGTAGKSGSKDAVGSAARFSQPFGVATDNSGNLLVADTFNHTIRRGLVLADTFVALRGIYNGLAMPTNTLSQGNSGPLKLTLTETGSFTAALTMGVTRLTFAGQFDESGNATNTVAGGSSSWTVTLHLDLSTEQITGTVLCAGVESQLLADHAVFSKANPCPLTGRYTFAVRPPSDGDPSLPQGWGYGTLKVASTGSGKLTGMLGDRTKFKATVPISKFATAPLHSLLYGKRGSSFGWLIFTNDTIESTLDWIKPAAAKGFYTGGFSTNVALLGSKYIAPTTGQYMFDLSNTTGNAVIALGGGNLAGALSNAITVATNNSVTILSGEITSLKLKLVPKSGTFKGTFLHPATQKTAKFQGVVLQQQNFGAGLFTGSNETGIATITPSQ